MARKWTPYGNLMLSLVSVRARRLVSISLLTCTSSDTFMAKTTRLYQDTRNINASNSPLDKLNDELQDVTRIITKNMEELLWRGDSLDSRWSFYLLDRVSAHMRTPCPTGMSQLSTSLRADSEKYRKAARNINIQAMIRQYAPIGAVVFILIILLWWRFS